MSQKINSSKNETKGGGSQKKSKTSGKAVDKRSATKKCLGDHVRKSVETYFKELNGEQPCNVYSLVMTEVEKPLLEVVMKQIDNNQSRASKVLGINRNTLRKKLDQYGLIDLSMVDLRNR